MGKHIPKGEHPLQAAPHSGSSPGARSSGAGGTLRTTAAGPGGAVTPGRSAEGVTPSQEQIAARAYEIWLSRGGSHGHHEEDWAEAERQLREEASR